MPEPENPFASPEATPPPPPKSAIPPVAPPRRSASLSRAILMGVLVVAMTVAGTAIVYLLVRQQKAQTNQAVAGSLQKLEQDYAELKRKYDDLETDRNNVLTQTKNLLQEKAKWTEMEEQVENLKKANKQFMAQKEKLLEENQRLKNEVEGIIQNFDGLKASYQEMLEKQDAADKENASLRDLLTKQVQGTPEYQLLDRESKRLRDENLKLGQIITLTEEKLKKALDRIKKDQIRELSLLRQVRGQKQMLDEIRAQNEVLSKTNRQLNDLINQAPTRIRDMAAQNQQLMKETAEMHYNMGVFFTENKQFSQAEREYLRALDFDPNNLKVHYNLGYLYSEELSKHDKAMFHLEKYLQINPNSKESESIRAYIATRQAWNGGASSGKKR